MKISFIPEFEMNDLTDEGEDPYIVFGSKIEMKVDYEGFCIFQDYIVCTKDYLDEYDEEEQKDPQNLFEGIKRTHLFEFEDFRRDIEESKEKVVKHRCLQGKRNVRFELSYYPSPSSLDIILYIDSANTGPISFPSTAIHMLCVPISKKDLIHSLDEFIGKCNYPGEK